MVYRWYIYSWWGYKLYKPFGGFLKWGYPQIIHISGISHCEGYPHDELGLPTFPCDSWWRMEISNMGVSWNGGTPSHHPLLEGFFHEINQPAIGGYPMTMETPRYPLAKVMVYEVNKVDITILFMQGGAPPVISWFIIPINYRCIPP